MRIFNHIIFFVALIIGANNLLAQEDKKANNLLVKNSKSGSVLLKWICEDVYYQEGFNLYRKTDSEDWKKLNTAPLQWDNEAVKTATESEPALNSYIDFFTKVSYQDFRESILKLVVVKSVIASNEFAFAIGLGFEDKTVEKGVNYTYRVTAIENGTEIEMDQTSITSKNFTPLAPPQDIVIERKKRKVNFNFKKEPLRYYGIVVTRTDAAAFVDTLTGKEPLPIQQDIDDKGKLLPWPDPIFLDRTIEKEEAYTYEFYAVDYFAEQSSSSGPINAEIIDFDPPQEAFNLDSKIDTLKATISWTMVVDPDRAGVNIYRYTNPDDTNITKMNDVPLDRETNSYQDQLPDFGTYLYKVGTFDAAGNEILSSPVMVQARDIIPPSPPTGLKTTTDTGMVNLTWKPSKADDLMGYVIFKVIDNGNNNEEEYTLVNPKPIKATNYTERMSKNVKNTFHYVVSAVDTSWNYSLKSEYSVATLPDHVPPVQPFIKMVEEKDKKVIVEWEPNKDEDLRGYNIYRKIITDSASAAEQLNGRLLRINSAVFEDKFFDPGTNYAYQLEALDSSGNASELSNEFRVLTSGTAKGLEVNLRSFKTRKKRKGKIVNLKWSADPSDQIQGFVLYRKIASDKRFEPYTGLLAGSSYKDKAFKKGATYEYQLRVYSKAGDIIRSEVKKVEIPSDK